MWSRGSPTAPPPPPRAHWLALAALQTRQAVRLPVGDALGPAPQESLGSQHARETTARDPQAPQTMAEQCWETVSWTASSCETPYHSVTGTSVDTAMGARVVAGHNEVCPWVPWVSRRPTTTTQRSVSHARRVILHGGRPAYPYTPAFSREHTCARIERLCATSQLPCEVAHKHARRPRGRHHQVSCLTPGGSSSYAHPTTTVCR